MPENSWAVAVTTAPRQDCTLLQCVESIRDCGWDPIVFAEPESTPTDCRTIQNTERLGVWRNWTNSVRWCLQNTDAGFILTVQDDSLFHPDSKDFMDDLQWPDDAAFVSLYTPKHYTIRNDGSIRPKGVNRIFTRSLWGACALVWPRAVLQRVTEHPLFNDWLGAGPRKKKGEWKSAFLARQQQWYMQRAENPSRIANSDTAIGKLANRLELAMYFVDPSPVEHIARFSTISHGDNSGRRNAWRVADKSLSLKNQVFYES